MAPSPVDELALLDLERSNKGASKQRRDLINGEIGTMRDLLPLPESARQRLSQLQIMSLSCVYIRKCNILQKMFHSNRCTIDVPCDFSQALTGFILVTTRDGKLVYISENVTEYLGHSMVDMKTQGDSLFDIVDKRDHGTVQAQLLHGVAPEGQPDRQTSFFCRMNMSRTLKRQGGFGDVKVMHVRGHFVPAVEQDGGPEQQVFMAVCTPLITPDVKESLIQNNTMVFKSVHNLDMSFVEITENGEFHLGVSNSEIQKKSWYDFLHPEDIHEARSKHIQLIKSRHEMGCMMTVRMLTTSGEILWMNIVMHVRQALMANSDDPVIVCINQVVSEQEAKQFKIQGQLFALYAARAPDFFFGAHHFGPLGPPFEGEVVQHGHAPLFMHPPGFFPDSAHFHQYGHAHGLPPPSLSTGQYSPPGTEQYQSRPQGHTDTLKALKRKLQENFISSCKPSKLPKLTHTDISDRGDGYKNDHAMVKMNMFRNLTPGDHFFGGGGGAGGVGISVANGPVQMVFQSEQRQPIVQVKKEILEVVEPVIHHLKKAASLEQVVPEVSIPDCYLTPDPSPASSPKPSSEICAKTDNQELKQLASFVTERLNELKNGNTTDCLTKPLNTGERKKKHLPIIDANFVDDFFEDLVCPRSANCIIKTEPVSPPPPALSPEVVHPSPPVQQRLPATRRDIASLQECQLKEELTFIDFQEMEDFLGMVESAGPEKPVNDPECLHSSPVGSPEDQSLVAGSPMSSSCGSPLHQDKMQATNDVLVSSPGYDSRDDILDPDSWLLEPVQSFTADMPCLDEEPLEIKTNCGDGGLFQLKKLLASWEPCGTHDTNKDTQ